MNINQYRQILNELEIKHFSMEELMKEYQRRKRKKRQALCLSLCLFLVGAFAIGSVRQSPAVAVTVYAADGNSIRLSDETASLRLNADVSSVTSTIKDGLETDTEVSIQLYFQFDEENLDTVTLSCSDMEITRNNLAEHSAYFVENRSFDRDSYLQMKSEYESDENFLSMLSNEDFSMVTLLVGNTCTIPCDGPDDTQYGIVLKADTTGDTSYSTEESTITADIVLKNGKSIRQKYKIAACEDILTDGIEISLIR